MAEGKWIADLKPETTLADAARWVMDLRLKLVRDNLSPALRESESDIEYVHQLRVSTRRARAALDIFALCLPDKNHRDMKKWLRRIRRGAGAARDWDVFLDQLSKLRERFSGRQQPGIDFLIGYSVAQRVAAQSVLSAVSPNHPFDFERVVSDLIAAVHKPPAEAHARTLVDLAQPLMHGLIDELQRAASDNLEDYDHLHQVRILGKWLRYSMEIFSTCFASEFRTEIYPAVESMQEVLGSANDSHVAIQRLQGIRAEVMAYRPADWKRIQFGVEALTRYHQKKLVHERGQFLIWREEWKHRDVSAQIMRLLQVPRKKLKQVSTTSVRIGGQSPIAALIRRQRDSDVETHRDAPGIPNGLLGDDGMVLTGAEPGLPSIAGFADGLGCDEGGIEPGGGTEPMGGIAPGFGMGVGGGPMGGEGGGTMAEPGVNGGGGGGGTTPPTPFGTQTPP